jgi:hypothetical protein
MEQARSTSPYLLLPMRQDQSSLYLDGIKLQSNQIQLNTESKEEIAPKEVEIREEWEDEEVQRALDNLRNQNGWALFKSNVEVFEHDRSNTPTLENPNSTVQTEVQERLRVMHVESGQDDRDFADVTAPNCFILISHNDYIIFCEVAKTNGIGFENCIMATWNPPQPEKAITEWDISKLFPEKSILVTSGLRYSDILNTTIPHITHVSFEQSHGSVDEYFAYNADEDSKCFLSNKNFLKKDILDTIFDDLWTEVYPKFEPLLQKAINSTHVSCSIQQS